VANALADHPVDLESVLAGLPLVGQLGDGWYRLHALWQPALAGELNPAQVAWARRTAGRVLAQRGQVAAAGRLYVEAGAWADLEALIVDSCQAGYPQVGTDVLGEWLRRLPPQDRRHPTAGLLEGILRWTTDPAAAQRFLLRAAEGYRATDHLAGEIACLSHLATILWWQLDREMITRIVPRVGELVSADVEGGAGDSLLALATYLRLLEANLAGDPAATIRLLESTTVSRFSAQWQALFDIERGVAHLVLGEPDTALVFAQRALVSAPVTARQGVTTTILASMVLLGRRDEVLRRLPEVFADPSIVPEHRVAAHALAACVLAWAGQPEQPARHLREAENIGRELSAPIGPVLLTMARLGVSLTRGDQDATALAARLGELCHGRANGGGSWLGAESLARLIDEWFLAVQYVLVPSARPWWDAQPLQGCFAVARDLAHAVVAVRRGDSIDPARLSDPEMMGAFLPPAWIAELAPTGTSPVGAGVPAPVEIRLLGPVRLLRSGAVVADPRLRRERVRELLAHLVIQRRATRQEITADLWPDHDPAAAARNLRVTLTHLTQLLAAATGQPAGAVSALLRRAGHRVELVEGPLLTADVWTVERLLDQAAQAERQHAPSVALARYQEALEQAAGPLLADSPGPEWLLPHRDRLQRRLVAAAVRAGDLLLASGAVEEPLRLARQALAADACCEPAHQLLVSAHLAAGDRTAARVALADCHRMLAALGAHPDARTLMLTRRLTGTHPAPGTRTADRSMRRAR
jgi:DNA-binding SARP family transcriptional activator